MPKLVKEKIRNIPNFPKEGIIFRDITTLLQDSDGLGRVTEILVNRYKEADIDVVAGIEARGFIIGGIVAHQLGKGFVPLRKSGKLPYKTIEHEYELEYGTDKIEIHIDSLKKGDKVLLIDDLLATGGTGLAGAKLVEKLGGKIVELAFIVDLPEVGGREKIKQAGYKVFSICEFEGE